MQAHARSEDHDGRRRPFRRRQSGSAIRCCLCVFQGVFEEAEGLLLTTTVQTESGSSPGSMSAISPKPNVLFCAFALDQTVGSLAVHVWAQVVKKDGEISMTCKAWNGRMVTEWIAEELGNVAIGANGDPRFPSARLCLRPGLHIVLGQAFDLSIDLHHVGSLWQNTPPFV